MEEAKTVLNQQILKKKNSTDGLSCSVHGHHWAGSRNAQIPTHLVIGLNLGLNPTTDLKVTISTHMT